MKTDAVNPSISRSQSKIKHLTRALYGQPKGGREAEGESFEIDSLCHRLSDAIKPKNNPTSRVMLNQCFGMSQTLRSLHTETPYCPMVTSL